MNEITNESIDELLTRVTALERQFSELSERSAAVLERTAPLMPALRERRTDESTPRNTVVRFVPDGPLFFWKGGDRFSASPIISGLTTDRPCFIDTLADLQFRMFLNAPKEYRWGAIDEDGEGYVYKNKPALGEEWWSKLEDALSVGLFPQYADEWDKILVEREESK